MIRRTVTVITNCGTPCKQGVLSYPLVLHLNYFCT